MDLWVGVKYRAPYGAKKKRVAHVRESIWKVDRDIVEYGTVVRLCRGGEEQQFLVPD